MESWASTTIWTNLCMLNNVVGGVDEVLLNVSSLVTNVDGVGFRV
jgi:hypothetical protein